MSWLLHRPHRSPPQVGIFVKEAGILRSHGMLLEYFGDSFACLSWCLTALRLVIHHVHESLPGCVRTMEEIRLDFSRKFTLLLLKLLLVEKLHVSALLQGLQVKLSSREASCSHNGLANRFCGTQGRANLLCHHSQRFLENLYFRSLGILDERLLVICTWRAQIFLRRFNGLLILCRRRLLGRARFSRLRLRFGFALLIEAALALLIHTLRVAIVFVRQGLHAFADVARAV